tara:strand:+ start:302 stop:442 length:141 start_codon:yes stop_codon:yes gene_type:complete
LSKGIKGRGKVSSTSRSWEKALKKNGNKKIRQQGKKDAKRSYNNIK